MNKPLTWWSVARRPKWVGGFFVAMVVAVVCGLLAQWQIGRSVEEPLHSAENFAIESAKAPIIDAVIRPGVSPRMDAVGTLVLAQIRADHKHAWVVANRVQREGTAGFWVAASVATTGGKPLIMTLGFAPKLQQAVQARDAYLAASPERRYHNVYGRLSPAEAPQFIGGQALASLSPGQLANLSGGAKIYPLFLLETHHAAPGLERITVETLSEAQINWLSAFYGLEWSVFMGFSFFMWWRLVRDEQQREQADATAGAAL
jgi:cytochrome oxidase assembly protein ShyY1